MLPAILVARIDLCASCAADKWGFGTPRRSVEASINWPKPMPATSETALPSAADAIIERCSTEPMWSLMRSPEMSI